MKRVSRSAVILILLFWAASAADAQGSKTIILVRHAERESGSMTDQTDPPLSAAGRERAERLVDKIGRYRPGAFYSTNFKRTRDTIGPLAKKRNKTVEIYDPAKPQDLIDKIMSGRIKRVVIVGHSNTIPPLANLLTGKDLFKNLQETEHAVIWIIRLKDNKVRKVELLNY